MRDYRKKNIKNYIRKHSFEYIENIPCSYTEKKLDMLAIPLKVNF